MTPESRQLPLFPTLPGSTDDLNARTQLKDALPLFQAHLLKDGKSQHTISAFTGDLYLLAEHDGAETALGAFTTTTLNEFLRWLEHGRGIPCSRKSYARRVTTLKVFFKWLRDVGAIAHDPALAILQRSGPAPLAIILSPDEVNAALTYAASLRRGEKPDARPEMIFSLLLTTGIKKNEAMRLTEDDILPGDPPLLRVRHSGVKDVYKERLIALDPTWLKVLDEYLAQYAPKTTIMTCTARNLEYILEAVSAGAGLDAKLSFEMLRWTCAVRDYRAGVDPDAIREKLGLSRISWVETFAKIKRLAEEQINAEHPTRR